MLDAAGDKEGYTKAAQRLKARREKYKAYCKQNGLGTQLERTQVYGFDRSQSSKAVWADKKSGKALTSGGWSGTMNVIHSMSASGYEQRPPDFSLYPVTEDLQAVAECKEKLMEFGLKESEIDLKGIKNADVLKPFVDRIVKIKEDTGMKIPPIITTEFIEGKELTIAGYKPYEGELHLSSKYFNSKDALLDTMKEWANNGIFPKQAKTINYLAEHEMAHARIDDEILKNDEAIRIHRQFCKSKYANKNDKNKVEEFYADSVAVNRISPDSTPPPMIEAVNYLKRVKEQNNQPKQKEGKG